MKYIFNNQLFLFVAILTLTSCNYTNIKKENDILKVKIEEKEETIRNQISEIEQGKAEVQLLKMELDRLVEIHSDTNPVKELYELYSEVKSSVYLIYTENNEGVSQGSAFVLTSDGIAISNQHVFDKASAAIAINELGDKFLISEILEENKSEDYIVFRLGPLKSPIPHVNVSIEKTKIGEKVFAVGNPKGLTQTLSEGIVSSYRENLIQTTAEITNGSSGGPLFNKHGEVIGITSSTMGEANLNFAIDINSTSINNYLQLDNTTTPSFNPNELELVELMNQYYSALINEDFDKLSRMYSNRLSRYHSLFSIPKDEALSDHRDYLSKWDIISVQILPNSFVMYKGQFGYSMQYKLDYRIRNKSNRKDYKYILNTVSVVDNEGQVESIYDNILKNN
jgi:serine protease Do